MAVGEKPGGRTHNKSQSERINGVGVSEEGEEKSSNDEIRPTNTFTMRSHRRTGGGVHEKDEMPFVVQTHALVHP